MSEKLFFFSLFLVILSYVLCKNHVETHHLDFVDMNKMVGEWYVVAGTPVEAKMGKCIHINIAENITTDKSGFRMNFSSTNTQLNKRAHWNIFGHTYKNGFIASWQLDSRKIYHGPYIHQILDTNYTKYATLMMHHSSSSAKNKTIVMIWSRQRTLPFDLVSQLKNELSKYVPEKAIATVDNKCS